MKMCEPLMPDVVAPKVHQSKHSYVSLADLLSNSLHKILAWWVVTRRTFKKLQNCQNWGGGRLHEYGRLPGTIGRLSQDDDQSTRGEGCKDQTGMSVGPAAKVNLITRPLPINRKVDNDNADSSTCTAPLQKSPENKEPSSQTNLGFQHSHDSRLECKEELT